MESYHLIPCPGCGTLLLDSETHGRQKCVRCKQVAKNQRTATICFTIFVCIALVGIGLVLVSMASYVTGGHISMKALW